MAKSGLEPTRAVQMSSDFERSHFSACRLFSSQLMSGLQKPPVRGRPHGACEWGWYRRHAIAIGALSRSWPGAGAADLARRASDSGSASREVSRTAGSAAPNASVSVKRRGALQHLTTAEWIIRPAHGGQQSRGCNRRVPGPEKACGDATMLRAPQNANATETETGVLGRSAEPQDMCHSSDLVDGTIVWHSGWPTRLHPAWGREAIGAS